MIHEFDIVTLNTPIPERHLSAGLEGTVVDAVHSDDGWVTVEFFQGDETVAVLPIAIEKLRLGRKAKSKETGDRPQMAAFILDEGVIHIPAWEWSSDRPYLFGHLVHTKTYPAMELRKNGLARIPTPMFVLSFDNGWSVAVALDIMESPKFGVYLATRADVSIVPGDIEHVPPDTQVRNLSAEGLTSIVQEVAERHPLQPN
jgi:hypothetical protein